MQQKQYFLRQDVGFLINVILGIFLFIALISYHPNDPAFYQYVKGYVVHNWEGFLGAHVAGFFLYLFGYGAYVLPFVFFYAAINTLNNDTLIRRNRLFGILFFCIGAMGLLSLHVEQNSIFPVGCGGHFGDLIAWKLTDWMDIIGATIVLSGLLVIGSTTLFDITSANLFKKKYQSPVTEEVEKPVKLRTTRPVLSRLKAQKKVQLSANLLQDSKVEKKIADPREQAEFSEEIKNRLYDFGIDAHVVGVLEGPVVTRYEVALAAGTKVSRISALGKDLARSLSVTSVRIVEVIPGKAVIGLEFPNKDRQTVSLKEIIDTPQFKNAKSGLTIALGKGVSGETVCADLAQMPHLLVAGTTGSGKSVGLNAMLLSMLYKSGPEDLRLILIDPKMLELSAYSDIPHLLTPVVTNMDDAAGALRWCVAEMERRYQMMAALGVRNISGYNTKVNAQSKTKGLLEEAAMRANEEANYEKLPYIVVVIDEFADMIMVVGKKVEQLIARLAQKARAAGIHIILATQRPSVDVITGLIKANVPTRIAFQVSSKIDSRTILDQQGAEALLGYGDMLYLPSGTSVPTRVHGAYVSDDEVHQVVKEIKKLGEPKYIQGVSVPLEAQMDDDSSEQDALYKEACEEIIKSRKVSISGIQRRFRIGYNRAANLVEAMEKKGVVSEPEPNGQRRVLAEQQE